MKECRNEPETRLSARNESVDEKMPDRLGVSSINATRTTEINRAALNRFRVNKKAIKI
jgi:hypothetical protein